MWPTNECNIFDQAIARTHTHELIEKEKHTFAYEQSICFKCFTIWQTSLVKFITFIENHAFYILRLFFVFSRSLFLLFFQTMEKGHACFISHARILNLIIYLLYYIQLLLLLLNISCFTHSFLSFLQLLLYPQVLVVTYLSHWLNVSQSRVIMLAHRSQSVTYVCERILCFDACCQADKIGHSHTYCVANRHAWTSRIRRECASACVWSSA